MILSVTVRQMVVMLHGAKGANGNLKGEHRNTNISGLFVCLFVCFVFVQPNTKMHTLLYLRGLTTVIFLKAAIKGERQWSRRCVTV